jgi:hypothetical protein
MRGTCLCKSDCSLCPLLFRAIAALRFQPTKRPQLSNQKSKPKSQFPKQIPPTVVASSTTTPTTSKISQPPIKSTLADWAAIGDDDDVNGFYAGEKRQRGGRKRRKKNREDHAVAQDWDDIYDPSRPNNYDEYKHSDEKIREVREWKDRLYAHRMARKQSSDRDSSDEEDRRPQMSSMLCVTLILWTLAELHRSICSSIKLQLCAASDRSAFSQSAGRQDWRRRIFPTICTGPITTSTSYRCPSATASRAYSSWSHLARTSSL